MASLIMGKMARVVNEKKTFSLDEVKGAVKVTKPI